ncbi:ribbon-helix-helix domain-containing protein [Sphingomonas sp. Ag1]|jgi:hypothetical protein|uniref:ribbon-helix-helix domain-containing protein n=1 Tax=Sphingomonas sp. Ag1 TaxID=1642949 RepID=UPI0006220E8A|nr:ribbon-helix-helix domain-containing protein [Sphingomonas sp. Ag1]KKI20328.1 hypothetical protein XM50_05515 [Sphingomonas sp. Ag1]
MSRKPSFANLRTASAAPTSSISPEIAETPPNNPRNRPESRVGRKQIAGFFTPEMSFAMHMLARRQGRSLQALMAEAFNDVLRKHGESPMGE